MTIDSVNPATGETVARYDEMTGEEVAAAIEAAHRAFLAWRETPFAERSARLRRAAELLRARRDDLAALMACEMGKPVQQGRAEADKCAWVCEHYAEHAESMLADQEVPTEARRSYVTFQPLGVILAVMPWNFPFWQVFRFAAPNLAAGNGAVLKHASNVFGCALAIEELLREAGFPEGLFRTLLIGSKQVDAVIEHPKVAAVTLTGSTAAGAAVAAKAGSVIKKTVLELGGSDPYLVLEDADIEHAAQTCVDWRLINSGQSCIAAKRFLVVNAVYDDLERLFVEKMAAKTMGDPFDEANDLGPQARWDLRDSVHEQVRRSIQAGARLLLGGEVPDGPGAYYPPTVLAGVRPGMPAFDEEVFGPVAALVRVADEEEAIELANRSVYGLGAAVFTRDSARGDRVARRLASGCCFVEAGVKSDPRLPFGGIRHSGYGRELGQLGIREFVNAKAVWVEKGRQRTPVE